MTERVFCICRLCRQFEAQDGYCTAAGIREIVDGIRRNGNTAGENADGKLDGKQEYIDDHPHISAEDSAGGPGCRFFRLIDAGDKNFTKRLYEHDSTLTYGYKYRL